ncbi:MAG: hypothetical protein Q9M11_06185 [Mariprofundaceae bacterium]|nr:hypothetical protein [Mariprofundaceae bacterium]
MTKHVTWGLLGSEKLSTLRRTRTLGLSSTIRSFNDLAVPGIGGVWYGKQILLATLGVVVAEELRAKGMQIQNIEMTNAIEALACCLAFKNNHWKSDARLLGINTLQGKDDLSFQQVRHPKFYVNQPMRMLTIQTLPALGFVESDGTRFNTFCCSNTGKRFVEIATAAFHPYRRSVIDHLTLWAQSKDNRVETKSLYQALSPLTPLSKEATSLLGERLIQGANEDPEYKNRRRNGLAWVDRLRKSKQQQKSTWEEQPQEISNAHWHDLRSGTLFFHVRDAAIAVLDELEIYIDNQQNAQDFSLREKIPDQLKSVIAHLRLAASDYLKMEHTDDGAKVFCSACKNKDFHRILRFLVERDQRILRLVGDKVKPGPAFRGDVTQTMPNNPNKFSLPDDISYRMRNLYRLNLDMHGQLEDSLNADRGEEKI